MKTRRRPRRPEPSTAPPRKSDARRAKKWDKNVSPVGWYVARYVLRFVELEWKNINDPEQRFLAWENTILVKARNLSHAHDKTVAIATGHTEPYKGGPERVDVQWIFEGVTEILPIYEQIEDGSEIMWAKYTRKLKTIRGSTKAKKQLYQ